MRLLQRIMQSLVPDGARPGPDGGSRNRTLDMLRRGGFAIVGRNFSRQTEIYFRRSSKEAYNVLNLAVGALSVFYSSHPVNLTTFHQEEESNMRFITSSLLLFAFAAALAAAQTYQKPPKFNHIVIIFQENRTPDDLFGGGSSNGTTTCGQPDPFEPGVDLQNGGPNLASMQHGDPYITCLTPLTNLNSGGTGHTHDPN